MKSVPLDPQTSIQLYLDLLKKALTRFIIGEPYQPLDWSSTAARRRLAPINRLLERRGIQIAKRGNFDPQARREGRDLPGEAETMVGLLRLDNLQYCIEQAISDDVPGDLIETGVWRGGTGIFMRAVLKAYGLTDRSVWLADSFEGLPYPDEEQYPLDRGDPHWTMQHLAVPVNRVKENFARYGLLDEHVRFLPGWFRDTLPSAPIERLAVLRLDGDMYESTMVALKSLYAKLSPGGFVIVDDYGAVPGCRVAVDDFRSEERVSGDLVKIDWTGVYWRKEV
jgi:O-methyltransferase